MTAAEKLLGRELESVAAQIQRAHRESLQLTRQLRDNEAAFDALVSAQREIHEALDKLAQKGTP